MKQHAETDNVYTKSISVPAASYSLANNGCCVIAHNCNVKVCTHNMWEEWWSVATTVSDIVRYEERCGYIIHSSELKYLINLCVQTNI